MFDIPPSQDNFCAYCGQPRQSGHTSDCSRGKQEISTRQMLDKGKLISPAIQQKIDSDYKKYEVDAKERDPNLDAVLNAVDFDLLKSIFLDYARKAGVPEGGMNFVSKDRIRASVDAPLMAGQYNGFDNLIGISYPEATRGHQEEDAFMAVLSTLVHEETHAVARNLVKTKTNEKMTTGRPEISIHIDGVKSGYAIMNEGQARVLEGFNEGMVEKLSREVRDRYLAARPNLAPTQENKERARGAYQSEVMLVEALIKRIAKEVELPEDMIWGGFVRGLFQGDEINKGELATAFAEMLGEEFIEKLSTMKSIDDKIVIFDMISNERILRFLNIYLIKLK